MRSKRLHTNEVAPLGVVCAHAAVDEADQPIEQSGRQNKKNVNRLTLFVPGLFFFFFKEKKKKTEQTDRGKTLQNEKKLNTKKGNKNKHRSKSSSRR